MAAYVAVTEAAGTATSCCRSPAALTAQLTVMVARDGPEVVGAACCASAICTAVGVHEACVVLVVVVDGRGQAIILQATQSRRASHYVQYVFCRSFARVKNGYIRCAQSYEPSAPQSASKIALPPHRWYWGSRTHQLQGGPTGSTHPTTTHITSLLYSHSCYRRVQGCHPHSKPSPCLQQLARQGPPIHSPQKLPTSVQCRGGTCC